MIVEIKIPSPGESINQVVIANWLVANGVSVERDQEIAEIESDKATIPLIASEKGELTILCKAGETVDVGKVVCTINTSVSGTSPEPKKEKPQVAPTPVAAVKVVETKEFESKTYDKVKITPTAQAVMHENNLSVDDVIAGLQRITKKDVETIISNKSVLENQKVAETVISESAPIQERQKMTQLRKKLSERLVAVKNETAMLTTFNEIDMSFVMELRKDFQTQFVEKHGVKLGLMSFFAKAACIAMKLHPNVNAQIDGDEIVFNRFCNLGIAVQTPKGLMVPVIRNAENLSLADLEKSILQMANKARSGRISIDELSGGTFTITNGGVFGSMLSTPILNPPQSGILGMHNIVERPTAVKGKVEIRPIMYVALSYDHRIIDGKDSVGFLVKVKEMLENPERMLFEGNTTAKTLLQL